MNDLSIRAILVRTRSIIAHPSNWCKRHMAVSIDGTSIHPQHPAAVRFCLLGAMHRASGGDQPYLQQAEDALLYSLPEQYYTIPKFNDTFTHEAVIAALDSAIEKYSYQEGQ